MSAISPGPPTAPRRHRRRVDDPAGPPGVILDASVGTSTTGGADTAEPLLCHVAERQPAAGGRENDFGFGAAQFLAPLMGPRRGPHRRPREPSTASRRRLQTWNYHQPPTTWVAGNSDRRSRRHRAPVHGDAGAGRHIGGALYHDPERRDGPSWPVDRAGNPRAPSTVEYQRSSCPTPKLEAAASLCPTGHVIANGHPRHGVVGRVHQLVRDVTAEEDRGIGACQRGPEIVLDVSCERRRGIRDQVWLLVVSKRLGFLEILSNHSQVCGRTYCGPLSARYTSPRRNDFQMNRVAQTRCRSR